MKKNIVNVLVCTLLITTVILSFGGTSTLSVNSLPPPKSVDMVLEESIFRRSSVRDFSDESVSDEDLSTILWAAYGFRDDGSRTVPGIEGVHGVHIYILKRGAFSRYEIYKYDPLNHSLNFYKEGSFPNLVQYFSPVYLGIVWDTNISLNENYVSAEIGEIGQNVYLMSNALNLGTVANVGLSLSMIGLPSNEEAKIIMPLGHPKYPYDFKYIPLVFSVLPRIDYSKMNLTTAIKERTEAFPIGGELTNQEQSQMIWSSYGYSYLLDKSGYDFIYHINRHRTVPSAHKYYPLRIYTVTESGIFRYIPNIYDPLIGPLQILFNFPRFPYPVVSFMAKIRNGDHREELSQICLESSLASAPLNIISVLDIDRTRPSGWDDLSSEELRWLWYYEAGASAYNILLEATAWNLSSSIKTITDKNAICNLLRLNNEQFEPLIVVPVGKKVL
jgi:nitroreductase